MALPSALALILWAAGVWLLDRHARVAGTLAGLTAGLGFVALVGYLADVDSLFGNDQFSQMSVGAGVGNILLGVGLLLSRPEREPIAILSSPGTAGGGA